MSFENLDALISISIGDPVIDEFGFNSYAIFPWDMDESLVKILNEICLELDIKFNKKSQMLINGKAKHLFYVSTEKRSAFADRFHDKLKIFLGMPEVHDIIIPPETDVNPNLN